MISNLIYISLNTPLDQNIPAINVRSSQDRIIQISDLLSKHLPTAQIDDIRLQYDYSQNQILLYFLSSKNIVNILDLKHALERDLTIDNVSIQEISLGSQDDIM